MKMNPVEIKIKSEKTARYYVLKPDSEPKGIIYVLHGYRQLAQYFILQFRELTNHGFLVVAPEGQHRFYIEGYNGRVGASWMTKEAREDDILDYIHFLNDVHYQIGHTSLPIHVLGFSQGGATACRWVADGNVLVNCLILHSSVFPDDFDFAKNKTLMTKVRVVSIFGDKDPFASESTIDEKMEWVRSKGLTTKLLRFNGGHEINLPLVLSALDFD